MGVRRAAVPCATFRPPPELTRSCDLRRRLDDRRWKMQPTKLQQIRCRVYASRILYEAINRWALMRDFEIEMNHSSQHDAFWATRYRCLVTSGLQWLPCVFLRATHSRKATYNFTSQIRLRNLFSHIQFCSNISIKLFEVIVCFLWLACSYKCIDVAMATLKGYETSQLMESWTENFQQAR